MHSSEKLKALEDEQELLNSSLFALTTHFAQVSVYKFQSEILCKLLKNQYFFIFQHNLEVILISYHHSLIVKSIGAVPTSTSSKCSTSRKGKLTEIPRGVCIPWYSRCWFS